MIKYMRRWFSSVTIAFGLLCFGFSPAFATGTLSWNSDQQKVSADLKSEDLLKVLEKIATTTHWHVYVEPDALHPVSAKFKNLPPGEALHLLFGDLNFALIPEANSNSHLYVFRTSRGNATQLIQPPAAKDAGKPRIIPNELIVRLKPGAKIEELAKLLGAKVVGRIDNLNAYRLQFPDQQAADAARLQLANNPDVGSVENNYIIDHPEDLQSAQAGAPPLQLQLKPPPPGGRPVIGLIDTAVQPLGGDLDSVLLKQLSVAGDSQLDPNSPSHGTSMAETMIRTLQTLGNGQTTWQILPIDAFGPNEEANTFDIAQAIVLAVSKGANPINLSLGSSSDSQILSDVIAQGQKNNIVFYGAKGNTPVDTPFYPAADPGVTAVTALDANGNVASWANQAPIPAIGARGTVLIPFGNQTWVVQGTSPAAAIATATTAALMEQNSISATAANAQLLKGPTPTTLPGK
jgi:hypothetical protein